MSKKHPPPAVGLPARPQPITHCPSPHPPAPHQHPLRAPFDANPAIARPSPSSVQLPPASTPCPGTSPRPKPCPPLAFGRGHRTRPSTRPLPIAHCPTPCNAPQAHPLTADINPAYLTAPCAARMLGVSLGWIKFFCAAGAPHAIRAQKYYLPQDLFGRWAISNAPWIAAARRFQANGYCSPQDLTRGNHPRARQITTNSTA